MASRASAAERLPLSREDSLVLWITRHWLALLNLAIFLYLALAFLAPLLMHWGAAGPARLIYLVYSFACHQLPDRSYFLFGERLVYPLPDLETLGVLPGLGILERRHFIGNEEMGWKVALCQRDVAIYGSLLAGGLLFGVLRQRMARLPWKVFVLFLLPIGVDGVTQLFGLRTSTWWLRTLTGGLFGLATAWLALPYVEEAMNDIRFGLMHKLDKMRPPEV